MKKKIFAFLLMGVLTASMLAMTACGGGAGESAETAETETAEVEPNAGLEGIVYTIPDNWTFEEKGENYVRYKIPDTDFGMGASITTVDNFAEMKDSLPEELKSESLSEFFEKAYKASDEAKKKNHLDQTVVKICDSDAYYTKRANEEDTGYMSASVAWLYEGSIYELYMHNSKAYDNEGNPVEGAELMHEDMLETFEGVFATVKPGDGSAFSASMDLKTIGSFEFETPEGYKVTQGNEDFVDFEKEEGDIKIQIHKTTAEEFANWPEGDRPETVEEYFKAGMHDSVEKTSIAGYDGYFSIMSEGDNGEIYSARAMLLVDDAVYEGHIDAAEEIWDEEGNIKEGITPLTDDDVAAFKALMNSLKKI